MPHRVLVKLSGEASLDLELDDNKFGICILCILRERLLLVFKGMVKVLLRYHMIDT